MYQTSPMDIPFQSSKHTRQWHVEQFNTSALKQASDYLYSTSMKLTKWFDNGLQIVCT